MADNLTDKLRARLRERWHACTHSHHRLGGMDDCPLCSLDNKLLAVVSAADAYLEANADDYHSASVSELSQALAALERECGE